MKPPGVNRRRTRRPDPNEDPATALRRYAVQLFDKGDGRAVDWPKVAETAFKVAFQCLDEMPGDTRALSVVRRVHDGSYNRLAGNPDNATAYTSDPMPKPGPGVGPALHPDHDMHR